MTHDRDAKLKEIDKVREDIKKLQDKLDALLFPEREIQVLFPPGFSLNNEILNTIRNSKEAIKTKKIHQLLTKAYPKHKIVKKRVFSALAYLKRKNQIESPAYGTYRIAQPKTTNVQESIGG